jgi:hypothetical protein
VSERENWLNLGQAADRLGMCKSWLQLNSYDPSTDANPKKVRCIRTPGGHRRFHVDEIRHWRMVMGMDGRQGQEPPDLEDSSPLGSMGTPRQASIEDYLLDPFQRVA